MKNIYSAALSLLGILLVCSSCAPVTTAPAATTSAPVAVEAPSIVSEPTQEEENKRVSENPYDSNRERVFDEWRYDLYEDMKGAELGTISDTQNVLHYENFSETERSKFDVAISLPQLDEPWTEELNRYYQDYLEREKEELENMYQEYLEEIVVDDTMFATRIFHITALDIYTWDHYCLIAVGYDYAGSRTFSWPRIDVFDTETGEHLGYEQVFLGERSTWEPVVQTLLPKSIGYNTMTDDPNCHLFYSDLPDEEQLVMTPSGIGFQYAYGELTSMAAGAQRIIIPFELLDGIVYPEVMPE